MNPAAVIMVLIGLLAIWAELLNYGKKKFNWIAILWIINTIIWVIIADLAGF